MTQSTNLADAAYREARTTAQDTGFSEVGLYIFELTYSGEALDVLPLVINPQDEQVSEPFLVTATPTLYGGLFVEENGVVAREITLSGTTGLNLRGNPTHEQHPRKWALRNVPANYSRTVVRDAIPKAPEITGLLSGQRHFQILQDRIFRTYSDLKRNRFKAPFVDLFLHVTRDRESFRVIPQNFSVRRDRTLYYYTISLLAVDKARRPRSPPPKDDPPGGDKKDEARRTAEAAKKADAGANTLDATNGGVPPPDAEKKLNLTQKIRKALEKVRRFVGALLQKINGVVQKITEPLRVIADLANEIDVIVDSVADTLQAVGGTIISAFRQITAAIDSILARVDQFFDDPLGLNNFERRLFPSQSPADRVLSAALDPLVATGNRIGRTASDANFNGRAAGTAFGQFGLSPTQIDRTLGTGPTPGQAGQSRSLVARTGGPNIPARSTLRAYEVGEGDTLQGIAARELNDATRWYEIASINGLESPFISDLGLPGTVGIGGTILLPDAQEPPEALDDFVVYGTSPLEPLEARTLKTDYRLRDVGRGIYDWDVGPEGTDFVTVTGVPNLQQGIRSRILEQRGALPLFPTFGTEPTVGRPNSVLDRELAAVRFVRSIEQDPRIESAQRVQFDTTAGGDVFSLEFDAVVTAFRGPQRVEVAL